MDPEAPTGGGRRGFHRGLRWLLVLVLILPLLAFLFSNLVLSSKWTRAWLAGKIRQRTTLETSIGGASWSPWNGLTFRDIRVEQPDPLRPAFDQPLIRIATVNARPVWKSIAKGNLEIDHLKLDSPHIVLPLELISHFAPPTPPPVLAPQSSEPSPAPPPLAANTTPSPAPVPVAPTPPAGTSPSETGAIAQAATTPPPAPATPASPTPTPPPSPEPATTPLEAPPPTPPAVPPPTRYLTVSDASFSLVFSAAKTPLFSLAGASGDIPIAGKSTSSDLTAATITSLGTELLHDQKFTLHWSSPVITLEPFEASLAGLETRVSAQLGMLQNLPAAFEIIAPQQKPGPITLPGDHLLKAESTSAHLRFNGHLAAPATWQAECVTTARQLTATTHGEDTAFDHARTVTLLRGGTLSCVDARIIGDSLSLLGNATVLSNGRAAAVLRIIAPPEKTTSIVRQFFPAITRPPAFSAMSTPQRAALDIEASGTLGDLQIRLGKNGPLISHPASPDPVTPP